MEIFARNQKNTRVICWYDLENGGIQDEFCFFQYCNANEMQNALEDVDMNELITNCTNCYLVEADDIATDFYSVRSDDETKLKAELRSILKQILGNK